MHQAVSREFKGKDKRVVSLQRAEQLKKSILDYHQAREKISHGFKCWPEILKRQEKIKSYFGATDEQWHDWHWQLRNRIKSSQELRHFIDLTEQDIEEIDLVGSHFCWTISPYYLSLMEPGNREDPIRKQAVPVINEYSCPYGEEDPMDEEYTSPAPAVTRRYPDRLIINVTNECAMFCRHCQRRRNITEISRATPRDQLEQALDYIRENSEIRDVLLTGGDGFLLSNKKIAWLLEELEQIPHVEIKRFGTRTPVTLPSRIDDELCAILSRHLPLYVNTQFNHPMEITPAAGEACLKLARTGVALGNQAVLLKGINNDRYVMRKLNQELLKIMVRPYYIFHAKKVKGTSHFWTRVEEGLEIMEYLRGYTSGLAIPTFILNAPHGYGKTPLLPNYLVGIGPDYLKIRTWENRVMYYDNREYVKEPRGDHVIREEDWPPAPKAGQSGLC
ncbi:MAG: glutamate 2,3-aminomutase [Firmicutes bacterium]|nr:glutamate 2,3-aminomutase [Bacillota bacterium]